MQCVRQNDLEKLPVSDFCQSVLEQIGVPSRVHARAAVTATRGKSTSRAAAAPRLALPLPDRDEFARPEPVRHRRSCSTPGPRRSAGRTDVELVVKDYGASSGDRSLRDWLTTAPGRAGDARGRLHDQAELIRLYKSCDAFVSAHRGEGFGMKILDAMACGLPVITPLFGGPTEFCANDTCFPSTSRCVPVGDCLDTRSLQITNDRCGRNRIDSHLAAQLRRVFERQGDAAIVAAREAARQ